MHRRAAAVTVRFLALASCLTLLPAARADEAENLGDPPGSPAAVAQARERFTRGLRLYGEGRLEASLAEFEKAVKLAPSYRLQYNIGRVQGELGNLVAAMNAFQRYLAEGGARISRERRAQVQREVTDLERRVARVNVRTNVPGAVIAIDEIRAGLAPLSGAVRVNPGVRRISALKAGYLPSTVTVTAASGEQIDVALELLPHHQPGLSGVPPPPRRSALQAVAAQHASGPRLKTWLSLLATGTLAATAGGFALLTYRAHQDFERKLEEIPDSRVAVEGAGRRIATFAGTTGALAVAALVAGGLAIHYGLTEGRPGPPAHPPVSQGLQLSLGAQPGTLLATGRF
jgi:tetratricopeptide (TPR) repeat protein